MTIRRIVFALLALGALSLYGCANMLLPLVPNAVSSAPAGVSILGGYDGEPAVATVEAWEDARSPKLRAALETHMYGVLPAHSDPEILSRTRVDDDAFGGAGTLDEYVIAVRPNGESARFRMALVTPKSEGPHPTIILQSFCDMRAVLGGHEELAGSLSPYAMGCEAGAMTWAVKQVFGQHAIEPPLETILARGYAVAVFHAGDVVPDAGQSGLDELKRLAPEQGEDRWGAIGAWAWLYGQAIAVLDQDPRLDPSRTAVWGHSRNGKSALLAGAVDPRVDLVIAHQSGTGGATLTKSFAGESVAQITEGYPHWFGPRYARYADNEDAIPVDAHQLIALIAPRPVLLGNAQRDKWSDPEGAFRAARAADPVYELYGAAGLDQPDMKAFNPAADLSFFLRPGRHGVRAIDWTYFLEFLDAHFASG